ncbi:MAG: ornithine carbamoyltransferase [Thermodesulfobacteriota bacterium]|nr:ornithine carbamoyltransferase [Thermodesulfobacteriota bacterium]
MEHIRHFLSMNDFSKQDIMDVIDRAAAMKRGEPGKGPAEPLKGKSVGLLFDKPSTRTRVSFDVGIQQLGGHAIFLNSRDIQLGRGEPIRDTARVLSRYLDAIVVRTFGQEIIEEFARWSGIPIINALTDRSHPCQILGDLLTLREVGLDIMNMKASWVGDGNNVANSWIYAAQKLGFSLVLACPKGYDPVVPIDRDNVRLTRDPVDAITGAQAISTDVWASMGQEGETLARQEAFQGFQLNSEILEHAAKPYYILHCLPAHRGEEISEELLESKDSLIWEEAENRLHVQKALLELLLSR